MEFEDLYIPVTASERIHAWWIPARRHTNDVILYLHGNGYTLEQSVSVDLSVLHEVGANLLAIDYRGYGLSSGAAPNEASTEEDARAGLEYLTVKRHVLPGTITIVGRSIGAGIGAQVALENRNLHGLVLLSPYTSVSDVARETWFLRILPLTLIGRQNQFDTLAKVGLIQIPMLVVVGSQDTLTPPSMAQTLVGRACASKRLLVISGADHSDVLTKARLQLVHDLAKFEAAVPSPSHCNLGAHVKRSISQRNASRLRCRAVRYRSAFSRSCRKRYASTGSPPTGFIGRIAARDASAAM